MLRRVRDPFELGDVLSAHRILFPDVKKSAEGIPRDGTWLRKRVRSAGGLQVNTWDGANAAPAEQPGYYFQRRIQGLPCSALYVAAAGDAVLLGITQQLIGTSWTGAREFQYAGSIGPLDLPAKVTDKFAQIGPILAAEFNLVGLFGVDAILTDNDVRPVEVNPRYTASVEVLEHALGLHAIAVHLTACQEGKLPDSAPAISSTKAGKAILYARGQLRMTDEVVRRISSDVSTVAGTFDHNSFPPIADVPCPGITLRAALPVCTLLARGTDCDQVERELQRRAKGMETLVYSTS